MGYNEDNQMPTIRAVSSEENRTPCDRSNERGAALVTVLLISMLLLTAGGALIMTTALSATNAIDSTGEMQAYYAAEAGLQASLSVLRGYAQPNPLFNTSSLAAAENKITFNQAVTTPTLSRWLNYSNTLGGSRVVITNPQTYSVFSGMAYEVKSVTDPDNTSSVSFSVSGTFPTSSNSPKTSITFGTGSNRATVTYQAPSSATIHGSGSSALGSFSISAQNSSTSNTSIDVPFEITISQSSPYPATTLSPTVLVVQCRLQGDIVNTNSTMKIVFPTSMNSIGGVSYNRTTTQFAIAYSGTTSIPATVIAPEPNRLVIKVRGYGPRSATKQMQAMVNRFAFDYKPNAAITIRGSSDGSAANVQIGNSSQYTYTGNDQSGGTNMPAFGVTNGADLSHTSSIIPSGNQVTGSQPVSQISIDSLSAFLQTAQGARDLLNLLRTAAYNEDPTLNRYFTSSPSDYGATTPNGRLTFVDGNAELPPGGGAGLLVVTGTLDMRGNADFRGLILVLGRGEVLRNGGGNGITLGSIVVAKFGSTGGFLAPTFDSNGGGTSDIKYDSKWIEKALKSAGPRVIAVSEY